ncbi:DNA helicase/exodeoxyribonuclease V, beta subunit [Fodinibius salinus]|uniref:DNA 3'-5' helicase n=1 Tax=Fodinibius salinus TaxID=860790 RepID=A0A5D3YQ02_9BACT|nr:exodeoxyribonuclease V subunit beta [Fodinibius salinus]TYP95338.1 DNA helicase/exodeoxyribonuclease V, beta subunit [Fodinibius salinus]
MDVLEPFDIDFSGINLVEASAGTGKTYNIMSLYIRAIIELDMPVNKILVVTYTEAATKELKDGLLRRIRKSISILRAAEVTGDDKHDQFLTELLQKVTDSSAAIKKLEQAVRNFDEAAIYTIHGFCYQSLQERAFESRAMYDAEMIGEDTELVQEAVDDYWRRWMAEATENPEKHPLLKLLDDKGIGPDSLAGELENYIGKPYLHILPEDIQLEHVDAQLRELQELHTKMRELWSEQRADIRALLGRDEMSNYRSSWLENWFSKMDVIFQSDTATVEIFDQFDRFTQSRIDNSLKKAAREKSTQPPQHLFFKLADEYQQIAHRLSDFDVSFKKELLTYLRSELNQKKEEQQVLSYDDLLLRLRNALLDEQRGQQLAQKMRDKYPIAMVDEFQDTDPNQYDIFRRIYRDADEGALFMIGDPKQSIYSFRGADVYSYIKARKDAPEENRFKLDRNFRSVPNLLKGVNAFWGGHENPFLIENEIEYNKVEPGWDEERYDSLLEYGQERPAIRFRRLSEPGQDKLNKKEARKQAAKDTAREIARLLEGGRNRQITIGGEPVEAKDIAVLVRKHKQADLVNDALQELDIKSVRHSDQSVFESDEAKQLGQLLKAVAEPSNETLVKTALSLPLSGYTANQLLEIEEEQQQWIDVLDQFGEWHRQWQHQGFAPMFRSLMAELNMAEHIIDYSNGERRLTNLLHLGELLQEESRNHKEGARSLLQWLARKRQENSSSKQDEEQLRLESDEELVKIVTMHKSKGLQYPIVFCPFLWHGPHITRETNPMVYHRPDDNDTAYLDLYGEKGDDREEQRFYNYREQQAESLRLAYVAMTRAQQCLYLTWQFASDSQLSSLGYLLQDPKLAESQLMDKVNYGEAGDWSRDDFHEAIGTLCDEHGDFFTLKRVPERPEDAGQLDLSSMGNKAANLESRDFDRSPPLEVSYGVSSFSSLTSWMNEDPEMPDYDQFLDQPDMVEVAAEDDPKTMFTFPKGPQPGTCIHHIFENIDFTDLDDADKVIDESLSTYGIDQQWSTVVQKMLEVVVHKSLHPAIEGLTLSELGTDNLNAEMEFYYQNEHIKTRKLLSIIRDDYSAGSEEGRADAGFLKGFIDLTFKFGGRYYLLDYKTNYLGDCIADYEQPHLIHEMQEASYDLQYHVYSIALHRFLKKHKQDDYSYEDHFGGAFYLFLRGMNKKGNEGIFFDRPDYKRIKELDEYIKTGGEDA